jgi:hypothetical protein
MKKGYKLVRAGEKEKGVYQLEYEIRKRKGIQREQRVYEEKGCDGYIRRNQRI